MSDSSGVDLQMAATLQHNVAHTLTRMRRSLLTGAGVAAFMVLWWAGSTSGRLDTTDVALALAAVVFGVGLVLFGLSIAADFRLRDTTASLGLPVTLWASLGCVATATFGNAPLRLALLAVTLLGLTFAALHLGRSRLRLIAVSTWATASLGFVLHIQHGQSANLPDEFLVWSCYSLLLVIALLVADQIAGLREELTGRTEELERALTRVRDMAMRDDLTGLYNRRQLMEYLYRQKALADRGTLAFALCYVDLDHFKRVNDLFGHKQGDEVLRAFADIARKVRARRRFRRAHRRRGIRDGAHQCKPHRRSAGFESAAPPDAVDDDRPESTGLCRHRFGGRRRLSRTRSGRAVDEQGRHCDVRSENSGQEPCRGCA